MANGTPEGKRATRPAISDDPNRWPCQEIHGEFRTDVFDPRGTNIGAGFVFFECPRPRRYLISWTADDQFLTRRLLRVCEDHGRAFAARHDLELVPATPYGGNSTAEGDQPYERVRRMETKEEATR